MVSTVWGQRTLISWLLWPLGRWVQWVAKRRHQTYLANHSKPEHWPPLIVVGNITVGGTGKSPMIIHLTELLQAQGLNVGIVSRGYGGKAKEVPQLVFNASSAIEVGDEPLMIARRTGTPVCVHPNRALAVNHLIEHYEIDVVLSDDGLQHYSMHRDIEIVMIDGQRLFGNGFCIPAGPMREGMERLKNVDRIVINGQSRLNLPELQNADTMQLVAHRLYNLRDPNQLTDLTQLQGRTIHAIAGLGNPQRFFSTLENSGLRVVRHAFGDHHKFTAEDLDFEASLIIMTEKDAVKCEAFARSNMWVLPIDALISSDFDEWLTARVFDLLEEKTNG
jgi:tetraacyldisaccharide 4'-kinase